MHDDEVPRLVLVVLVAPLEWQDPVRLVPGDCRKDPVRAALLAAPRRPALLAWPRRLQTWQVQNFRDGGKRAVAADLFWGRGRRGAWVDEN